MSYTRILKTVALSLAAVTASSLYAASAAPVKAGKVGFVDVQKVVQGTSAGAAYIALNKKLVADQTAKLKNLQTLQAKLLTGKATAADQKAFAAAQASYQASLTSAAAQRQKAFAPVASKVNAAVASAAKAQGYSVVMDKTVAGRGLVVYANTQTTDLTASVQKALK